MDSRPPDLDDVDGWLAHHDRRILDLPFSGPVTHQVSTRTTADGEIVSVQVTRVDGEPLTATELARFAWSSIFAANRYRHAAETAGESFTGARRGDPDAGPNAKAMHDELRRIQSGGAKRPGRAGHPDAFYAGIAARYLELVAPEGRAPDPTPIKTITEQERDAGRPVSRNTVATWVKRSRSLNYLPPAKGKS